MLPVSDGVVMPFVLPVLRMTSCFRTMGPLGGIKHNAMFRRVRQVAVPVRRQTAVVFDQAHRNAVFELCKSVYDRLALQWFIYPGAQNLWKEDEHLARGPVKGTWKP